MSTPYRRNAKTPAGRIAATPSTANWGGFFGLLQEYAGAAAGYSLRKIGSGPVVRLRRASDNEEKDFAAGEVVAGTAGAELVTNGGFDTDTDWTKASNWTITGGQAVSDGTVAIGQLRQDGFISSEAGVYYKITFTVVACSNFTSAGTIIDSSVATGFSASWQITSTGTYSAIFKTTGTNSNFGFWTGAGVTMTLDDVSCVPYTPSPAELWALNGKSQIARQTNESAYATTWYDQSGSGNDASQATAASQPLLIRAGVTNTDNGKAALSWSGSQSLVLSTVTGVSGLTVFSCVSFNSISNLSFNYQVTTIIGSETSGLVNDFALGGKNNYARTYAEDGSTGIVTTSSGTITTDQRYLISGQSNAASSFVSVNGSLTSGTGSRDDLIVDAIGGKGLFSIPQMDGNIQEIIVYPSDQSANRVGIETNINDHYGIY